MHKLSSWKCVPLCTRLLFFPVHPKKQTSKWPDPTWSSDPEMSSDKTMRTIHLTSIFIIPVWSQHWSYRLPDMICDQIQMLRYYKGTSHLASHSTCSIHTTHMLHMRALGIFKVKYVKRSYVKRVSEYSFNHRGIRDIPLHSPHTLPCLDRPVQCQCANTHQDQ